jgi:tetratricopeptide (TPR) repeat protein
MIRGAKTLVLLAATTLGGCTSEQVNVRPIADPAAKFRQGNADIAAARGQLALGNVGLALEAFRIIQRNRPDDPAALAGIGDCYAAMGRFDLAQSNFEQALAMAPHNPTLLLGLASVFEREGDHARALAVRAEASVAQTAAAQAVPPVQNVAATAGTVPPQQIISPRYASSVTVALPKARPADRLSSASVGSARLAQTAVTEPIAPPAPVIAQAQPVARPGALPQSTQSVPTAELRSSITVALPEARPADGLGRDTTLDRAQLAAAAITAPIGWAPPTASSLATSADLLVAAKQPVPAVAITPRKSSMSVDLAATERAERLSTDGAQARAQLTQAAATIPLASTITVPLPPARPAQPQTPEPKSAMPAILTEATGPRMERMSSGEVMLVTTGRSPWHPQGAPQVLASAAVHWIPLGNAAIRPNVQVVNAARRQGIARSARSVLLDRGWRRIAVGDATEIRQKSVVLYPKNRSALGRSLARQFGVASRESNGDRLVLVLGQDAAELIRSQRKS